MDQDVTWHGAKPRPGHIVLDGDPATPPHKRGHSLQCSAHVCCGQTAGWIKMTLGMMVGLSPGNTVLDADPPPPPKGHSPLISAHVCCGQTAGWIKMPISTNIGLGPGRIVTWGLRSPSQNGHSPPNFWPMSIVAKRSLISATADLLFKVAAAAVLDF